MSARPFAHVVALALVSAATGCRAIFGVDDAPERPADPSATSSSTGDASSGASDTTSSTDVASTGGTGGTGGAGGDGGASAGGGGAGTGGVGGDACVGCGGVACCLGACEGDVCSPTTFDLGGEAMRLADSGDAVAAIVLPEGESAGLQWIPADALDALPDLCGGAAGDADGLGYVVGYGGDAYYSQHGAIGRGGNAIAAIARSCAARPFSSSVAHAGLAVRGDDLLAVMRGDARVRCLPLGGGEACTGAADDETPIVDGFALALDGDTLVWGVSTTDGEAAALTGGPPFLLGQTDLPVDIEVPTSGTPLVLTAPLRDGVAHVLDVDAGSRCAFDASGALGFAFAEGRYLLPHADGLLVCFTSFEDCVLQATSAPVRDVLVTSSAVYYSAGKTVTRIQRPLGAFIATLPTHAGCTSR